MMSLFVKRLPRESDFDYEFRKYEAFFKYVYMPIAVLALIAIAIGTIGMLIAE